jgi:hypothetical protein
MTDKRYYGLYRAVIVDNNDPLGLGRITVQVPQVTGLGVSNWIESCSNGGGVFAKQTPYGSFTSYTTQYGGGALTAGSGNSNVAASLHLEGASVASDVYVAPDANGDPARVTVKYAGVYKIAFAVQISSNSNADETVSIWFRKNGTNVIGSNSEVNMVPRKSANIPFNIIQGWTTVVPLAANDYYELMWSTSNAADVVIQTFPTQSVPTRPTTASVFLTVTAVGNVVPAVGDNAWVMYMDGDPNFPVWMGV